jgi:hypothetical protein
MAFAKGVTVVNCLATDTSGNTAACSFTITVLDDEAPIMSGLSAVDVVVAADAEYAEGVTLGVPTVTDNCDPAPVVTNNAPTRFRLGHSVVTWTARDAAGNTSTADQDVFVSGPPIRVIPVASFGDAAGGGGAVGGSRSFLSVPPPVPPMLVYGVPIVAVITLGDPIQGCFRLENIDPMTLGTVRPAVLLRRVDFSATGVPSVVYVGAVRTFIASCGPAGEPVFIDRPYEGFEMSALCCEGETEEPFFTFQMGTVGGGDGTGFDLDPGYYELSVKIELPGGFETTPWIRIQIVE